MIKPSDINVLIACEESQAECLAFRELGFNAFSADLQKARYDSSFHILGDVTPLLKGGVQFNTQDGAEHCLDEWHLIVAHPPCTYICKVSSVQLVHFENGVQMIDEKRLQLMKDAVSFFYCCLNSCANYVAIENPLPMKRAGLPKPSFFIQPSWFGVKYTKKTLFWTKNLPPLMPELIYPNPKEYVRSSRGKYRSRTFPQVAAAMAKQWGNYILTELNSISGSDCNK